MVSETWPSDPRSSVAASGGCVYGVPGDVAIRALGHIPEVQADANGYSCRLDLGGLIEGITHAQGSSDRSVYAVEYRQDAAAHELHDSPAPGVALRPGDALKLLHYPRRTVLVPREQIGVGNDFREPDGGKTARGVLGHALKMRLTSAEQQAPSRASSLCAWPTSAPSAHIG